MVLEELGRSGTGSLGDKNSLTRLNHQLLAASSSLQGSHSLFSHKQSSQELPASSRVSESFRQRGYRGSQGPGLCSLLFQALPGSQRWLVEASYRPQPPQPLHKNTKVFSSPKKGHCVYSIDLKDAYLQIPAVQLHRHTIGWSSKEQSTNSGCFPSGSAQPPGCSSK